MYTDQHLLAVLLSLEHRLRYKHRSYQTSRRLILGFGAAGAPIATSITNTLMALSLAIYTSTMEGYECWGGWKWSEALDLRQIWIFIKLGVPGVMMLCSEWWAFEVTIF